jgi:uncharacterized protein YndB with AHSA1/START domain
VTEALELRFDVACSPALAFDVWATRTSLWWPRDHSVSADPDLTVAFEPRPGGRIYERTSQGVEHDWGEVVLWQPPHRLVYRWHLGAERPDSTDVSVSFTGEGDTATVTIVHRGWERLGAAGPERRERNRLGWGGVIRHFRDPSRGAPGSGAAPKDAQLR